MAGTSTIAKRGARKRARTLPPTRLAAALFAFKANVFRARRTIANLLHPLPKLSRGDPRDFPFLIAESRTRLWIERSVGERALEQGKVHNLRAAAQRLDRTVIGAGDAFSFWNELGKASRARGFVAGRMLREGCLVPAVGGGLCQLSNALYDVALRAGLEITEHHAHSRVVPGSQAASGRDATIAWNYVDLRFRSGRARMLRVQLGKDHLRVTLLGQENAGSLTGMTALKREIAPEARSCATCGEDDCFRHEQSVQPVTGRTAFCVDEYWPEFDAYIRRERGSRDLFCIPIDGRRWGRPQYNWSTDGFDAIVTAPFTTLKRSIQVRRQAAQGALRQTTFLNTADALAQRYAAALTPDVASVCVTQPLLPYLWRNGHLGGRSFRVLMTRLPMAALQSRLDEGAKLHPECGSLSDFRAPAELLEAESEALMAAEMIVTAHAEVALLFGERAILLDWSMPKAEMLERKPERLIAFPGPTVGRKGCFELREAAKRLGVEVLLLGSDLEGPNFWDGIQVRREVPEDWLSRVAAMVQPSFVEEKPRGLLTALASGVPVIATRASGIPGREGLTLVPPGDVAALTAAIESALGKTAV